MPTIPELSGDDKPLIIEGRVKSQWVEASAFISGQCKVLFRPLEGFQIVARLVCQVRKTEGLLGLSGWSGGERTPGYSRTR